MNITRHTSQPLATTLRASMLAFIALAVIGTTSAFGNNTDDQAIPPIVQKSTVADLAVPDIVPLQGAITLTVGHPNAMFVANTGYQTAFLDGQPVSFGSKNIIAAISPQESGTGYAIENAATQQVDLGEIGTNLGATSWSPPATLIAVANQADTSPGIFALTS